SVQNNRFDHTALVKFLKRNVGRYVFSRAEYEGYKQRDDLEEVALDAVSRMRSQQDGMGLGEILLYVLLEQILEAPKVLSKIELNQARGQIHSRCDAIHLLTPDGQRTTSSIVFGTSSVVGNIGDAITAAFERVVDIEKNRTREVQLAENTVFTKTLDETTAGYVKDLLIPKPGGAPVFDTAYSMFLGYDIGLDPKNYGNQQYRSALDQKMQGDIAAHAQMIANEINTRNLDNYSFYIYVLPLNEVDVDAVAIMDGLVGGQGGSHV
ncbi:HamA C-terminal domain-containing protein, partial [Varibaculum cambriense]|uniref:HamA C-terminal domain-containing protein n=1 Tax=Varibaculum cambriense TaxID=184870 RepID=UPI0028894446